MYIKITALYSSTVYTVGCTVSISNVEYSPIFFLIRINNLPSIKYFTVWTGFHIEEGHFYRMHSAVFNWCACGESAVLWVALICGVAAVGRKDLWLHSSIFGVSLCHESICMTVDSVVLIFLSATISICHHQVKGTPKDCCGASDEFIQTTKDAWYHHSVKCVSSAGDTSATWAVDSALAHDEFL